ncbi:ABC transporter ATP-binding protein [Microbacterium protaetiae]|uniref:ABC transporter ATP-binding protein n=1 Tax=Microbacterium protaetiae TaxID=2509458 RepID=A0A4P6EBH6_9MICO|nr:ABC transporter ATP-binding protein [Microbacterium protaetiae]QAY59542.1 ABC transporter ATP-binding protein [Microbacterium protaetiae]
MTEIVLTDLRKEYGDQVAIPELDLSIEEGEFFTLLGPSGCGKTTLLRMIAGFNSIESGTIAFDGKVVNAQPPADRNIGMVFQNYALFPQMTAAKNVAFGLQNRKVPAAQIKRRVAEALERVRMGHLLDRMPGAMSGGQQQRVALARALVISPDVLLMDEPLSNLDAKLRVEMRDTIREVQREAGITTVYVTHDQEEAMAVSDRIAVMKLGEIQQVGTPAEIYHRPANTFVAEFIGKTNFLTRTLQHADGRVLLPLSPGITLDLTDRITVDSAPEVIVSVRPEAVTIGERGIAASIVSQTFLGSHSQVRAELASGEMVEFQEFSQWTTPWHEGDPVSLVFDATRVRLFDAVTKASIMRDQR